MSTRCVGLDKLRCEPIRIAIIEARPEEIENAATLAREIFDCATELGVAPNAGVVYAHDRKERHISAAGFARWCGRMKIPTTPKGARP